MDTVFVVNDNNRGMGCIYFSCSRFLGKGLDFVRGG